MDSSSALSPLSPSSYYSHEQECDQLNAQIAQGYHSSSVAEQMRREDSLSQKQSSNFTVESHGTHFMTDRSAPAENQGRFTSNTSNLLVGDNAGSLSNTTTTGSANPSLPNPFTPNYQINYSPSHYLPLSLGSRSLEDPGQTYNGWRADSGLIHPVSPSVISREHYAYTPASGLQLTYSAGSTTYPTTPCSSDTTLAQAYTPASSLYDSNEMPVNSQEQSQAFPFQDTECERQILTAAGDIVKPNMHAIATKGFFTAQGHWTCYRRNYFGLNASYDLGYMTNNIALFIDGRQIKAFAVHLSANIEGQEGKTVELVQYTPKRDLGEKSPIVTTKLAPSLPYNPTGLSPAGSFAYSVQGMLGYPYLPLQNEREPGTPESPSGVHVGPGSSRSRFSPSAGQNQQDNTKHSFDRVQFKGATQNNGKRRASQQFYVLVVELLADVRSDDAKSPDWKRVAYRSSDKLVVRGRSPSHYKDSDGRVNNHTSRGGHQGGYNSRGQHGSHSGGHGGASSYNSGPGNPGAFRPSYSYSHHSSQSPGSTYSTASQSSNGDAYIDVKHPMEPNLDTNDLFHMQNYHGYRYVPNSVYQGTPVPTKIESPASMALPGVPSLGRCDNKIAIAKEYPSAVPGRHWSHGEYNGYVGTDTSRGWYAEIDSGALY